jgi:hypothetical protein
LRVLPDTRNSLGQCLECRSEKYRACIRKIPQSAKKSALQACTMPAAMTLTFNSVQIVTTPRTIA